MHGLKCSVIGCNKKWKKNENKKLFVNSSGGGAGVPGMKNTDFSRYCRQHQMKPSQKKSFIDRLEQLTKKSRVSVAPRLDSFKVESEKIILDIKSYSTITKKAFALAERAIKRQKLSQDISEELRRLERVDSELENDFTGKEFINIALQKIIHKINSGADIDFGYPVKKETLPLETSRFLYREMLEVAELNILYLTQVMTDLDGFKTA